MRNPALSICAAVTALLPLTMTSVGAHAATGGMRAAHVATQSGEIDVVQAAGHSQDLWAITDVSNGDYNVARLHRRVWHTLPATSAQQHGLLFTITAPTASAVWVAGEVYPKGPEYPAIYRWDGAELIRQKLPTVVADQDDGPAVTSISAASVRDGWAVSDGIFARRDTKGRPTAPVALHWNGEKWTSVRTPKRFVSVIDLKRGNAWAVASDSDLYHWNGKVWKLGFTVPGKDELTDIAASSSHNIIAVGDDNARSSDEQPVNGTYILRYNGTRWAQMVVRPRPTTPLYITAVTVVGNSAWAVAGRFTSDGIDSVILHSSGGAWRVQQKLGIDDYLADVTASSSRRVFAGGNASGAQVGGSPTFLERYDGTRWRRVASKF